MTPLNEFPKPSSDVPAPTAARLRLCSVLATERSEGSSANTAVAHADERGRGTVRLAVTVFLIRPSPVSHSGSRLRERKRGSELEPSSVEHPRRPSSWCKRHHERSDEQRKFEPEWSVATDGGLNPVASVFRPGDSESRNDTAGLESELVFAPTAVRIPSILGRNSLTLDTDSRRERRSFTGDFTHKNEGVLSGPILCISTAGTSSLLF